MRHPAAGLLHRSPTSGHPHARHSDCMMALQPVPQARLPAAHHLRCHGVAVGRAASAFVAFHVPYRESLYSTAYDETLEAARRRTQLPLQSALGRLSGPSSYFIQTERITQAVCRPWTCPPDRISSCETSKLLPATCQQHARLLLLLLFEQQQSSAFAICSTFAHACIRT